MKPPATISIPPPVASPFAKATEPLRDAVGGLRKTTTGPRRKSPASKLPFHEVSAGGLVFQKTRRGLFFAMMIDSYGKWAFPKGHVEKGESLEQAAARETMEELGLDEIRLLESLGKIEIWFRDRFVHKGSMVHKDIHYFLFECPLSQTALSPQLSEGVVKAEWVPASKVLARSSYPDMIPVIRRALAFLRPGV